MAVHSVQAQFSEDHLMQYQHLEALELVDTLVDQVLEVSSVSTPLPMDRQDCPTVESEHPMDSDHPTSALVGELETMAPLL